MSTDTSMSQSGQLINQDCPWKTINELLPFQSSSARKADGKPDQGKRQEYQREILRGQKKAERTKKKPRRDQQMKMIRRYCSLRSLETLYPFVARILSLSPPLEEREGTKSRGEKRLMGMGNGGW